ncbi:MAG: translation initiation factor IF-2 [Acidobacteriota bacterium]|jgi:translation initiation factor IF-2
MGKIRVYEIAEKIGLTSDQLIARLKRLGIDVHSNLSTVDEAVARPLLAASEKLRESATKEAAKEAARERKQVSKKKTRTTQTASARKQMRKARAEKARKFTEEYEKREADELARRRAEKEAEEAERARQKKEAEEKQAALEEERKRVEAEAARRRQAEAEARRQEQEALRKRAAEDAARRQLEAEEAAARDKAAEESAREAAKRVAEPTQAAPAPQPRAWSPPPPRRRGARTRPGGRKKGKRPKKAAAPATPPPVAPRPTGPPKKIAVSEGVTIKELAEKMEIKSKDLMRTLMLQGVMATINQPLEPETAKKLAEEFNFEVEILSFEEEVQRQVRPTVPGASEGGSPRPPVVTIMGHVDHGKTSLLDAIRESNVIAGEAGGITQHIGAYHVEAGGRYITFLDTPGHEAFTLMRSRGAQVTDIVVLVVAADDGVMPQTREAVDHARAAEVPLVVAVNKIDKPEANPDVVMKQLADLNLVPEEWGGDTIFVQVSAKKRTGLEGLLEMILLVADVAELKAEPEGPAYGTVLEAKLDRARGALASVLVQNGTLHVGDPFIAGLTSGKVRAMFDEVGHRIESAGPSIPVELTGLDGIPDAGDSFQVLDEERRARTIMSLRQNRRREERTRRASRPTLEGLFEKIKKDEVKELPIVLKCDVQGSAEVLRKSLEELGSDKVKVRVLSSAIGGITETDVLLASSSGAIVVGFHVRPERSAQALAEKEGVDIRLHNVIYNVTKEIEDAMLGLLEPTLREDFLGRAEVRETFKVPKAGMVAGCYITEGRVPAGSEVRLLRDHTVVYEGRIASLRRFKDDASEVREGYECGIGLERFNDVKVGDVIEAFKVEKVMPQTL